MRFLLVLPRAESDGVNLASTPLAAVPFQSRGSSDPRLLRQYWTDLSTDIAIDRFDLDVVGRCQVGSREYFAMEIVGAVDDFDDVVSLENTLSSIGRRIASIHSGIAEYEFPWVARYALLSEEHEPPMQWMGPGNQTVELDESSAGERVTAVLGWGNGLVRGWEHLSTSGRHHVVRGIVDAQHIWHDASVIVERNDQTFARIMSAQHRPRRREVRAIAHETSRVEIEASSHQLLLDDLIRNVQGARRQVAETLLQAWDYDRFVGRLLDRVQDSAHQLSNLRTRIESRYQSAVQSILLVLGFLAVVDISLSLIGTAHSGAVDVAPGGDDGFFFWMRHSDADYFLVCAVLAVTLLSLLAFRRR